MYCVYTYRQNLKKWLKPNNGISAFISTGPRTTVDEDSVSILLECVLLLQTVFSSAFVSKGPRTTVEENPVRPLVCEASCLMPYYRMCSLTTECVLM